MDNLLKTWQEMSVKNSERSQTWSYLQANKLACPSSMDDGRRHESPGLEMKSSLQQRARNSSWQCISSFLSLSRAPVPQGWHKQCQIIPAHEVGYRERNPELREPNSFWTVNLFALSSRRHCLYLERLQINPPFATDADTTSIFHFCSYTNILKI